MLRPHVRNVDDSACVAQDVSAPPEVNSLDSVAPQALSTDSAQYKMSVTTTDA